MTNFKKLFKTPVPIIGMIHVSALPGTPKSKNSLKFITSKVREEAIIYKKAGIDAVAIENMHDTPYLNKDVGPEITAMMTRVGIEIKNILGNIPAGIQILAAANKEALAVAQAAGLDFIRAEGFVFSHIADEGMINSCAAEILRYRKHIGAENILIFTDIKKKHSAHAITSDVSITETAHAAEFFLSDGVIVTGVATGTEADAKEISAVKKTVKIPVMVGSGVTYDNLEKYFVSSDGIIVGSSFKKGGYWENELDLQKVKRFMQKVKKIRSKYKNSK